MKQIWVPAILVPLAVVIAVALGIIAIGELLLAFHGTPAIIIATVGMALVLIVAVILARGGSSEGQVE